MPGHSPRVPAKWNLPGQRNSNEPVRARRIGVSIAVGAIVHFDRLFRGAKPPMAGVLRREPFGDVCI